MAAGGNAGGVSAARSYRHGMQSSFGQRTRTPAAFCRMSCGLCCYLFRIDQSFRCHSRRFTMFSAATMSAISAVAFSVRTAVERPKLRDKDVPGESPIRRIATCWSCGRPIALKPGFRVYHCESCDVGGSDEPAIVRATIAEQKCYLFVGCDGRTTVEHYVEHNDSSLPSPA